MTATLTAGTHDVTVTSFTDPNPSNDCHITGLISALCGPTALTEMQLLENASGTGTLNGVIHLSGIELLTEFGSCLAMTLTGSFTASLDSTTAATTVTLSGQIETSLESPVAINGTLGITQSGVYGIATF